MRNALSVDVEDWFQVGAFETVIDKGEIVYRDTIAALKANEDGGDSE